MKLQVAYSSDDNYARHVGVSMLSLFENNRNFQEIDVYLIDNQISEDNKSALKRIAEKYNRNLIFYSFDELCKDLKTDGKFSVSAFGRIFLAQIKEIDKILYLDCDSVITDSFSKLWEIDIRDYYICGGQDNVEPFYRKVLGLDMNYRYINTGFLLINTKKWREEGIVEKSLEFISKFNGSVPHHDQGTINAVCTEKILLLPPQYNLQCPMLTYTVKQICMLTQNKYYSQEEIDYAKQNPVFIHFTAGYYNRPWNKDCTHPYKEIYLKYLDMTIWRGQLENNAINRNSRIMKKLFELFPFTLYKNICILLDKRKMNKFLKKRRNQIRRQEQ